MNATTIRICMTGMLILVALLQTTMRGAEPRTKYEPTWESLDQHQTPKWFMDAKFGLFVYAPGPTIEQWEAWRKRVGVPAKSWRSEYTRDKVDWDIDAVVEQAADAGAKYIVLTADARSHFLLWPSKYADIEGSRYTRLDPGGRDYVAEFAEKVRARGLRFGIYRNYMHPPSNPYFLKTMYEMIDKYHPDTLWFDEHKLSFPAEVLKSRELLAYYYNRSPKPDEVAAEDALGSYKYKHWDRQIHGDWSRKEMHGSRDHIFDGYFVRYETIYRYRSRSPTGQSKGLANNMIEWLIDAVAKNGNLELATHPGPKHIVDLQTRSLKQMGLWLEVNGEAIYATRPWFDAKPQSRTAEGIHVRYTTKGDSLYAILFDWPERHAIFPNLKAAEGTEVRMLGVRSAIDWEQTDKGLMLHRPSGSSGSGDETEIPCDHAFVYKITPRPEWIEP